MSKFKIPLPLVCNLILCFAVLVSAAGNVGDTKYDYGDISRDVSDISFYEAAENADVYSQRGVSGRVDNVILLIGDGMGPAQVQLARLKAVGADGKLYMEKLPVTGLMRTHSADRITTDSAAAGTALACGVKTNNGIIGMTADKKSYQNLLEAAQDMNKAVGLVATSTVSHATPASFASHIDDRGKQQQIALQILRHNINVIFGGGRKYWLKGNREDGRDLLSEAKDRGYTIVAEREQMFEAKGDYVLGLFNDDALTTFSPEPSIAEMTDKAIELLNNSRKNGFFIMIEGSQIDWACHANNNDNCIKQTLLFDLAVKEAVEFAKKDKHTLVVVTADHECGGLVVFGGDVEEKDPKAEWATSGHSPADVPVYAFGSGAENFCGVMDNTEVAIKLAKAMGVEDFPVSLEKSEQKQLQKQN
jgi:alkaline phosphatase